jgi:cell division septation protein DedD
MALTTTPRSDEQQLKQRAIRRLAIALALIAAAIIGLAVLDRYASEPAKRVVPGKPTGEPPPIAALPQVKPVQPAPEAATPPTRAPSPALPPPPPPVVSRDARAPLVTAAPSKPAQVVPEATGGALKAPGPPEQHAKPAQPGKVPEKLSALAPAPGPGELKGFVVQMGVFTTPEHAQALAAKLRDQGIPVFTETRVVVGPFRTRTEAATARKRLKELGMSGMVSERK